MNEFGDNRIELGPDFTSKASFVTLGASVLTLEFRTAAAANDYWAGEPVSAE